MARLVDQWVMWFGVFMFQVRPTVACTRSTDTTEKTFLMWGRQVW